MAIVYRKAGAGDPARITIETLGGLVADQVYFVVDATSTTFKLASADGEIVSIGAEGAAIYSLAPAAAFDPSSKT